MPMTKEEAVATVEILGKYMTPRAAAAFANELNEKVGKKTENYSVRDTLDGLATLTATAQDAPRVPLGAYIGWLIIFTVHWFVALANLVSVFVLTFAAATPYSIPEWSIACPLCTFIVWTVTSRNYDCPFTRMEDWLRHHYKLPRVRAFLKYYLVDPLRWAWQLEREPRNVAKN